MSDPRPYHHGDLREAIFKATVAAVTESGPASLSLRDLARRAGVSHAAPAHHFGDKAGLLTEVAARGYELLADTLETARRSGRFIDIGVAYVCFALNNRAYFEVMYRPDLYRSDHPAVQNGRARCAEALYGGASSLPAVASEDSRLTGIAAWSFVHGFATLWLNEALPAELGDEPETAVRAVAATLFQAP